MAFTCRRFSFLGPCLMITLNLFIKQPVMMSAAWEGARGGSIVARHEWKGLSKLPGALEDWVEKKKLERLEPKGGGWDAFRRIPVTVDSEED